MPVTIRLTGVEQYLDKSGGSYIKALILGEPSAGKTRFSSFWPRPIFAAAEDGLMSVADRHLPYASVKSTNDMESLLLQVEQECRKGGGAQNRPFDTFVLDTADAMQRWMRDEILKEQRHDAMELRDWGLLGQRFDTILRRILRLPLNVVVTCHTNSKQDGDGPQISGPGLQGASRDTIAGEFDLVGHMATFWEAKEGVRVLKRSIKWHPEPAFPILKDRSGQLPKFTPVDFAESDFETLRDAIFGGAYFENLPEGEEVTTIPDAAGPEIVEPTSGPVTVKAPAKKAAPAPEPKATPQARKVPPAKKTAAPVQETPQAGQEEINLPTPEETPAAVEQQDAETPVPEPSTEPEQTPEPERVDVPEQTDEGAEALVRQELGATEVTPPAAEVRSPELVGIKCGTPALGKVPKAEGCGKDLGNESMDTVNIATFQMWAQLCQDCFTTARKEGKHKQKVSA